MYKKIVVYLCLLLACSLAACSSTNSGSSDSDLASEARAALGRLYQNAPGAKNLAAGARAVLVFPEMTKAGFLIGGQYGNGVLFKDGREAGYFNSTALSYGLQAGAQKFGYALFFMNEKDLDYLYKSEGWEVGVGPSITIIDQGRAASLTSTTARDGVFAFFFEQKGLMAGLGIQGTKITKVK